MYKPLKAPAPSDNAAFAQMDAAASGTQRAARTVRFADQEDSQPAFVPSEPAQAAAMASESTLGGT